MCVGEIFRQFSTTDRDHVFQDCQPSHLKHCRMANTGAPRRSAMAIRSDESFKRVPNIEQGRVSWKAPEKDAAAAIKRAVPAWSGTAWIQRSWNTFTNGASQNFCFAAKGGWTTSVLYLSFRSSTTSTKSGLFLPPLCRQRTGSRCYTNWCDGFYRRKKCRQSHLRGTANTNTSVPVRYWKQSLTLRIFEQWNVKNRSKSCII